LAVEAAMIKLADFFGEDGKIWGICGLLHDIDYEKVGGKPSLHSKIGAEDLRQLGIQEPICEAVLTHNEFHSIPPKTLMAKALYCVDPLTGLIVASALVLPTKKLNDVKADFVLRKFKEKSFAKGAAREIIQGCEDLLRLDLEKFISLALSAMQGISEELGL